jgi:D-Tyr-tRNAtyr deacylase
MFVPMGFFISTPRCGSNYYLASFSNQIPGFSIMIVPQASMGGTLKGKAVQYHDNVHKDRGLDLYNAFSDTVRSLAFSQSNSRPSGKQTNEFGNEQAIVGEEARKIIVGTYGNRQGFSMNSDGPHTYVFELP